MTVATVFRVLKVCPWCSSEDISTIATRLDKVPVKRCNQCQLAFTGVLPDDLSVFYDDEYFMRHARPGLAPAITGYEDYETSYSPSSFRWLTLTLKAIVGDRPARLLDVGAATGTFLEMARYEGFDVVGSELNEAAAQKARNKGLDVVGGPFRVEDWPVGGLDVITALEVLEHVTDLRSTLGAVESLLARDGVFCFFVPNVPDHLVKRYGDEYLDFNKSLDHTLYFNPTTLRLIFDEVFGPGSLRILVGEVPQWGQAVSYALGIVRKTSIEDRPETLLFDLIEGSSALDVLAEITATALMATALSAAKFFEFALAERAIAEAAIRGISADRLAPIRAQIHRNKGEILKAIETLLPVAKLTRLRDPLANSLLIEMIEELLPMIGITETPLDRGLSELVVGADQTQRALEELRRQVEVERERVHVDARLVELTNLLTEFNKTLDKRDREHSEAVARLQDREVTAQLATDKANATVVGLQTMNSSLAADKARLETELATVYRSRAWRMVTALRSFKYGLRDVVAAPIRLVKALGRPAFPAEPARMAASSVAAIRSEPARLLSVVIPVFNKGRDLNGAIDSVLESTVTDVEMVVWDDGSTDSATIKALEQAALRPGVSLFRGPNRGVVTARNAAMAATSSQFICCLDPDDRVDPTYFEKALAMLLTEPDIGIVYPWASTTGDKTEIWETQDLDPGMITSVNHVPVCAMFRREAFLESGGYSNRMSGGYEDWEYWAALAELGFRGKVIPEPLFHYLHRSSSRFSRDAQARRVHEDLAGMIERLHPGLRAGSAPTRPSARDTGDLTELHRTYPSGSARPIVVMIPWFTVGGADRVVQWLVQHWVEKGRTVVVIATEVLGEGMQDKFVDLLAVTPYAYKFENFLAKTRWLEFVSGILSSLEEPILFNVGSTWLYEHVAAVREAVPTLRVIDQQFNDVGHLTSNLRNSKSIDFTVAAYHELADQLRADGRPSDAVRTIHVGVEKPRPIAAGAVRKFRSSLGIPDDARLVLWVGRLAKEKRPEWIVRLAETLGNTQTRFLIVGDGPLAEELGQRLTGCPWINWQAHLESMDIAYAAADVVAITSTVEGVPLTLMEALLAGVPVVATKVGGVPDLDGLDGLVLVSPHNFTDLSDRLAEMIKSTTRRVQPGDEFGVDEMLRSYDHALDAEVLLPGARGPVAAHSPSRTLYS